MRKLANRLIVFLFFLFPLIASAQNTITGRVLDDKTGQPVANASVIIKGNKAGVRTDANGNFTITAKPGDVITISSINYVAQSVKLKDNSTVYVKLVLSDATLSEVVVTTAMDIKRKPRELGYSVATVTGKEVAETQRQNFVNGLQGRVAGLTVTPTTGAAGASSSIVLRGFNSLSGNNQPLFIVDGVIIDNQTINENGNGGAGLGLASDRPNRNNDYTNRAADLNPNDIESITILKGPEATALYGSQASGGAIVITTKKGNKNKKINVNYDNSFRFQKVTRLPDINNDFSQGTNGVGFTPPQTSSQFSYFGPAYPSNLTKYDNIHNFYKTGFAQTHNVAADYGTNNFTVRLSGTYYDEKGVVPENTFRKMNVRLSNSFTLFKKIDFTGSATYTTSENDKPIRGAGGYLLNLYAFPVINDIRNYQDVNGNKNIMFSNQYNSDGIDNPLWSAHNNRSHDKTTRTIVSLGVTARPFKWLTLAGRFGFDNYNTVGWTFYHPESVLTTLALKGGQDNYWRKYNGYNHTITATASKKIRNFTLQLMAGTMWQDYETKMYAIYGTNLIDSIGANGSMYKGGAVITKFDPTDTTNTLIGTRLRLQRNNYGQYNLNIIREIAYFGEFSINYKNYAFLNYTHRFESASTLPANNRNYNYPGVSLSLILSDIIPDLKKTTPINYWKLRASTATTARLNDPYTNQSYFTNNFSSNNIPGGGFSYYFTNNNPNLVPEKQTTYEIGTELKMLNNRVSIDATYYNTLCTNQISQNFRASYATGFVLNTQNAASNRNQGIEIGLDLNPLKRKNLNWDVRFNFNHTWSKVLTLPSSIDPRFDYYIADTWLYGNARGGLIRGNPTTIITGYGYARNNAGDILINPSTGLPVVDATFLKRGDRNPKFTLGTLNTLRYKNFTLSFLFDLKVGGDIFNATEMYLTLIGKSSRTADRLTARVVKGVLNDGLQNTSNPTRNTIMVIPQYVNSYYTTMPEEEFIQKNVNWLRLRDVTLSYNLKAGLLKNLKAFKSLNVFVTGNDLLLITNYLGADPAVNGNTAGTSGVGAFGFDYGNLPTPMSVNFGLRAGF